MLQTIRETARQGIAPEHLLRRMVAQGTCPGIYSGNRFLVNTKKLIEYINAQSERPNQGAGAS